jgi:hypothetical protein
VTERERERAEEGGKEKKRGEERRREEKRRGEERREGEIGNGGEREIHTMEDSGPCPLRLAR